MEKRRNGIFDCLINKEAIDVSSSISSESPQRIAEQFYLRSKNAPNPAVQQEKAAAPVAVFDYPEQQRQFLINLESWKRKSSQLQPSSISLQQLLTMFDNTYNIFS